MSASDVRIKRFVGHFIRNTPQFGDSSDMWINDPERAERCWAAAEHGAMGSTHAEIIADWRQAFRDYIRDRMRGRFAEPIRFIDAVEAHFDALEAWHAANGSLHQEVG